ncbi:hypothetical protein XENORESO_022165, partial [Xenotaenia resolanae]
ADTELENMLFCHPQPESYHQHSTNYIREALAPFLKNEEARLRAASGVQRSPFQYVLCAATSPAVKQQEETLSYLNQVSAFLVCRRSLNPPFPLRGWGASLGQLGTIT